ncbi:hypothetical protein TNIN_256701 [Trichonephila inaurata madagascariensis]|uniref:Uncharacterized protein n=1 Tax=Trichonephila inaurata madagascariensis TaxID=2747483 RepID=A0A8X6YBH1_9ARAC|nr:hypothetical protein TNIN_256701 [Trichonephila inaurata madagascariensis]
MKDPSRGLWGGRRALPPLILNTSAPSSPPCLDVGIDLRHDRGVHQGAETTPKAGVDELTRVLPHEVRIVEGVVGVQLVQVTSQVRWALEVLHVDVGVRRSSTGVVFRTGTHHDGKDVVAHVKAAAGAGPGALLDAPTLPDDVHSDVLRQLSGVLQAPIASSAIGHEPGHFPRLAGRIIADWAFGARVQVRIGDPLLVGSDHIRIMSVGGGPVEESCGAGEGLRVKGTLEEEKQPDLERTPLQSLLNITIVWIGQYLIALSTESFLDTVHTSKNWLIHFILIP